METQSSTTSIAVDRLGESTLLLTELYGENHNIERVTLVRIPAITHIAEYWLLKYQRGHDRGSAVHFVSGESIIVRETPEAIAAVLP